MAPQFTRQSVVDHMILIAILLTSLPAFVVGEKQETDPGKSNLQGGAVSYSHVVHDYGPAYKYAVKSSPPYVGTASHGYAVSSTQSAPVKSTTGYASSHGYASQPLTFIPLSHTYAKPSSKSPDVAYIQSPSVQTHQQNRLNSVHSTSPPHQFVGSINTLPKYDFSNNLHAVSKQVPYPVFQPYSLTGPYSVAVPVPVRTPYAVAVPKIYPITVDKPAAKQVAYPVKVPIVGQSIPLIVPYPFYITTKDVIRNDVQGHGGYSPSQLGVY